MTSKLVASAVVVSVLTFPALASADVIDDFSLTGPGLTLTFSIPGSAAFPEHLGTNSFTEDFVGTRNGVMGYSSSLTLPLNEGATDFVLGGHTYCCQDFIISSRVDTGVVDAYGSTYEDVGTITPGQWQVQDLSISSAPAPGLNIFTLTITQEATTPALTPEPSTLALLATGAAGGLRMFRRRNAARSMGGRIVSSGGMRD